MYCTCIIKYLFNICITYLLDIGITRYDYNLTITCTIHFVYLTNRIPTVVFTKNVCCNILLRANVSIKWKLVGNVNKKLCMLDIPGLRWSIVSKVRGSKLTGENCRNKYPQKLLIIRYSNVKNHIIMFVYKCTKNLLNILFSSFCNFWHRGSAEIIYPSYMYITFDTYNTAKIQHCLISKIAFNLFFKPVVCGRFGRFHNR
jgi:hypothetical protein